MMTGAGEESETVSKAVFAFPEDATIMPSPSYTSDQSN